MPNTQSIWKAGYQPSSKTDREEEDETCNRPCLAGKEVLVKNPLARRSPVKRAREGRHLNIVVRGSSDLISKETLRFQGG